MAPWVVVLVAGLIGFIWLGPVGAVVGLVGGYILSILLGTILSALNGGLVPRKAKQQTVDNRSEVEWPAKRLTVIPCSNDNPLNFFHRITWSRRKS